MQFFLSQRAHLPTALPGLEKAPVQNFLLHVSQHNPKASSIHYPKSNPRVLFINGRNSTFKGAGLWNSCWQFCHYPNYTKLPSSRELWPTMPQLGTLKKPGRLWVAVATEYFGSERQVPTIFLLCNSSPLERKALCSLASSNTSIHNPPMYTQTPWRFAIQTDWVGQRQWQDKVSHGIIVNSPTGGGCWLL